jgi:hypothetical protein
MHPPEKKLRRLLHLTKAVIALTFSLWMILAGLGLYFLVSGVMSYGWAVCAVIIYTVWIFCVLSMHWQWTAVAIKSAQHLQTHEPDGCCVADCGCGNGATETSNGSCRYATIRPTGE